MHKRLFGGLFDTSLPPVDALSTNVDKLTNLSQTGREEKMKHVFSKELRALILFIYTYYGVVCADLES